MNTHFKIFLRTAYVFSFAIFITACGQTPSQNSATGKQYHVAKTGSDSNAGTKRSPFLTINKAAQVALAGDSVIVHEGVYREYVNPAAGGESNDKRITYRAADGEEVVISGSELAKGWNHVSGNIWKLSVPESFFGELNPFNTLIKHPERVDADEAGDGWGWLKYGRWTHRGDVFIEGEGLTERKTQAELADNSLTWYTETVAGITHIWANFAGHNPNEKNVEINSREYAFYPQKPGLNFITLKGFIIKNVASHWAPPTKNQPGAVGSNGGNNWVIEDNIVMYAKAGCISIGMPTGAADQSQAGHHIIRNNILYRCGQGGVLGQSWNSYSVIEGNHIEDTNYRKEFGGWETAALKFHGAEALVIRNNLIRNVGTIDPEIGAAHGIWNDFNNQNWRVSNNVIMGAEGNAILAEANWKGPNLYENNVIFGGNVATYSSIGDAWVHNLFIEAPQRWENQKWQNRPRIANARWLNNIFVTDGLDPEIDSDGGIYHKNAYLDGAEIHPDDKGAIKRTVTDTHAKVIETRRGITVLFNVDEVTRNAGYPIVTQEIIDLNFDIDATVANDFYGNMRVAPSNGVGPFAKLQPGGNEFEVFEFSKLYRKVKAHVNLK